ncbi:hypothetical protein POTOM_027574 [Populus tomentosa]|uniref:peroxidase n=1 Tax=Populus tomentosa TaxID=118781 RepID=A0A8X7ZJ63_POPTO|nr:hypothetical protein POTOM_027574 [Populus tomentosa]
MVVDLHVTRDYETLNDVIGYKKSVERLRVHIFLNGLDEEFEQIRGEILKRDSVLDLEETYEIGVARPERMCTHCGETRHTKLRCYELIGYPEWWDFSKAPRKRNLKTNPHASVAVADPNHTSVNNPGKASSFIATTGNADFKCDVCELAKSHCVLFPISMNKSPAPFMVILSDAWGHIDGPYWDVPTGRRDGRVSIANEALFNLPSPFAIITVLRQQFAATGLSVKDLAVLSGKGDADPSLDPRYVAQLKKRCKPGNSNTVVEMDPGSFNTFDEDYYSTIVAKRRGLFQSDSALLDDAETRDYVRFQSRTQGSTFAQDFAESKVKMGNIGVLTSRQGEIRKRCAVVN